MAMHDVYLRGEGPHARIARCDVHRDRLRRRLTSIGVVVYIHDPQATRATPGRMEGLCMGWKRGGGGGKDLLMRRMEW